MKKLFTCTAFCLISAASSAVFAHGPQIELTRNATTGKIETRDVYDTHAAPTVIPGPVRSAYVLPVAASGDLYFVRPDQSSNVITGQPNYFSGPGIAYQYASSLAGTNWEYTGSGTLPNLQNSNFAFNFSNGLKRWNGSAFVDPGTEQIYAYRGTYGDPSVVSTTTADFGTQSLALASIVSQSGNSHSTVGYQLVGDPSNATVVPKDGIYMLSTTISSTAAGVGESDLFRFLFYKNASQQDATAAALSLGLSPGQIQAYAVPEPATFGLAGAALGVVLTLRRRRAAVQQPAV